MRPVAGDVEATGRADDPARPLLFVSFGTLGDVRPVAALAVEAQSQGRAVVFASTPRFKAVVEALGIAFVGIGNDAYLDDAATRRQFADRDGGTYSFWKKATLESLIDYCAALRELADAAAAVIAPTYVLSAVIVAEAASIPFFGVCLGPVHVLRGHWTRKVEDTGSDISGLVNAARASQGLRPRMTPQLDGIVRAEMLLGMYPPAFDRNPAAYIRAPIPMGYPSLSSESETDLNPALREWMRAGPFIMFSFGSYIDVDAARFFEAAAGACDRMGVRGLYVSPFSAVGLTKVVGHMRVIAYVPHHLAMPHALAVVHHGGLGSLSAACDAGRPMVVVPFSHDQPYNAEILKAAGLAEVLDPWDCQADKLERALRTVLDDESAFRSRIAAADLGNAANPAATAVAAIQLGMRASNAPLQTN